MQPMGLRVVPYTPEVSCNLVCKSQIQVPARGQHCLFYLHKLHRSSGNFEGDSRLIPMQEGGKHSCVIYLVSRDVQLLIEGSKSPFSAQVRAFKTQQTWA